MNRLEIEQRPSTMRGVLLLAFFAWGVVGFAWVLLVASSSLATTGGVGVGSSSYVTANAIIWIGGLIFFGLGALITDVRMTIVLPARLLERISRGE